MTKAQRISMIQKAIKAKHLTTDTVVNMVSEADLSDSTIDRLMDRVMDTLFDSGVIRRTKHQVIAKAMDDIEQFNNKDLDVLLRDLEKA